MHVSLLAGSKGIVGLLAAVCMLLMLQLSPRGLVDVSEESNARVGPVASWKDFPIRFGPAVRRLVEADESEGEERMIVAAVQDPDEATWIQERLGDITSVRIYQVETDSERRHACQNATAEDNTEIIDALSCWPHMASGSGREASVYLKYIIDEYDGGLADTTVFIHGHLEAWHRPEIDEFVDNMRRLRWGEIGYGSLRTWGMLGSSYWDNAVMIDPADPARCADPSRNTERWHPYCHHQGWCMHFTYHNLGLHETFGRMPHEIRAPGCCAEFVASRQRIKARPKQFYINLMERLDALGPGDESSPYAVEHIWHAVFGEPWVSYGIGKCELLACSEEEENDPDLRPPETINDPYSFHKQPPEDSAKSDEDAQPDDNAKPDENTEEER